MGLAVLALAVFSMARHCHRRLHELNSTSTELVAIRAERADINDRQDDDLREFT